MDWRFPRIAGRPQCGGILPCTLLDVVSSGSRVKRAAQIKTQKPKAGLRAVSEALRPAPFRMMSANGLFALSGISLVPTQRVGGSALGRCLSAEPSLLGHIRIWRTSSAGLAELRKNALPPSASIRNSPGPSQYRSVSIPRLSSSAFMLFGALLLSLRCPLALASTLVPYAPQYTHTAWTDSPGLKGRVNAIVQTSDGYLWLGTDFGLVRFDGVRFVPSGPEVGPSLPSTNILSLLAARDGSLWVGTLNGLVRWHRGRLTRYPGLAGTPVFSLLEDREGTVWAGGSAGLCAIRTNRTVKCSEVPGRGDQGMFYFNGSHSATVYSLYEDSEGHLWAGTDSGLWRWTPGPPHRYSSEIVRSQQALVAGDEGRGLIADSGTDSRVLLQTAGKSVEEYTIPGVPKLPGAEVLLRDSEGALWIGTMREGLLRVQDGTITTFDEESGLSDDLVTFLLEDREGTMWVGTNTGLDRLRQSAVLTISAKQGLSTPVGCVLAARDGSLWIGSYGGLNKWDRGQLTIYRATAPPVRPSVSEATPQMVSGAGKVTRITDPGLPGNAINSLFQDPRGRIWVGTDRGTAWLENGRFHRLRGVPDTLWITMFADAHEGLWIAYPGSGLFHVIAGRVAKSVPWPWSQGASGPRLSAIVPDPLAGGLWLGFLHGGVAYFKDGHVQRSLGRKDGLASNTVWDLHMDHEGTLWAATEGGLSRIKDGRVTTLTSNNGLPCDSVKWVIEDDAFSLWLNTSCGLLRIDRAALNAWAGGSPRSIHPLVFDRTDGVRLHALGAALTPVVTKSTDGRIWFVTLDGVSAVDPLHLPINPVPPPVHIEQITADGQTYPASSGLRLPSRLRDLAIDYTALSLAAPQKMLFRFMLEGQDPHWREVLNVRRVQYSNLAPGNYRFRVTATNNSGVWSRDGATVNFSIAPAYWQTNWFRALCGATFLLILWVLYQVRLRQVAHAFHARLEERVAERTRIARDLHDTLLQSVQALLLRLQTVRQLFPAQPARAEKVLESAIDQTARAITEGREAVQGLRDSTVVGEDLAVALRTLGEELAAFPGGHASIEFSVEVEGTPRNLRPIVRDQIYRIAGEAMRNAFRHAEAKQIEVELHYDERQLRLRVRDDGRGIDPIFLTGEGRSGHFGLRGMHDRAKLIRGKLAVWSAQNSGTEIELSVPAVHSYAASAAPWRSRIIENLSGKYPDRSS
jgi:signal transduction histidine kinase/ligand-binding sensor domain-containing protein